MRPYALFLGGLIALATFAHTDVARADCGLEDGGSCAVNTYCGFSDGGESGNPSVGECLAQPCVLSSDCEVDGGSDLCDTSHAIFQCVQCISTADCPGVLVCDPSTRTCVNPPPVPDGGEDAGGPEDAAAPVDAAPMPDAATPTPDASTKDASVPITPDAALPEPGDDAGPSPGTLAGGACDCDVAKPVVGLGASFAPIALGLLFGLRRRSRRRLR